MSGTAPSAGSSGIAPAGQLGFGAGGADDVSIQIGATRLYGWTAVRITRSCERLPSDFVLAVTEKYPQDASHVEVKPGNPCQIMAGSDLLLTGYVDRYRAAIGPQGHSITIAGRGKCEDLVDCSATDVAGHQVLNASLLQLATTLAAPFGISVSMNAAAALPALPQIVVYFTDTPYAAIERPARYSGLLVYEGTDGNLILSSVGTTSMASGFAQAENIQQASVQFSMDERFSDYYAYLFAFDTWGDVNSASPQLAHTTDAGVPRHRPRAVVSTVTNLGENLAVQEMFWEQSRRYGRSFAINVVADSWRDAAGRLWEPNSFANIDCAALKIPPASWIISTVSYIRDAERGTVAEVLLMPQEAFMPQPTPLSPFPFGVELDAATTATGSAPSQVPGPGGALGHA
ncbi:MAG TPA: hypothetical protein VNE67_09050 [Acetobacteraceae bacterium]|nr:hypothetical protein [Acetobacteraceae bacterium]